MKRTLEKLLGLVLVMAVDVAFWLLMYWAMKKVHSLAFVVLIAVLRKLYA